MYILNTKALGLVVSDKNFSYVAPYISLCKTCDPPGGAYFLSQGYNLNKVGRSLLDVDSYQISKL